MNKLVKKRLRELHYMPHQRLRRTNEKLHEDMSDKKLSEKKTRIVKELLKDNRYTCRVFYDRHRMDTYVLNFYIMGTIVVSVHQKREKIDLDKATNIISNACL